MRYSVIQYVFALPLLLWAASAGAQGDGSDGPGVENVARPAGTLLSHFSLGGRMATFHRGYFYIMGQNKTTLWDVSSFTDPVVLDERDIGDNGHRWWKFNTDMFWREYSTPEIEGSGYHFVDMSNMLDIGPWTDDSVPMPIEDEGQGVQFKWQALETWPTGTNGGNLHDARFDNPVDDGITSMFDLNNLTVDSMQRFRIGNLLFITATESAANEGLAVLDIGDPENPVILDEIVCDCTQYTTTYHVWGDHLVTLSGNNDNDGGNNMITIDFSDPTDLKMGEVALPTDAVSTGRYMYYQDEYGFAGDEGGDRGVKVNMETGEVVQEFFAPDTEDGSQNLLDYQWMPLGSVVAATGSNNDPGRTFYFQHQDQPDTRGPEIRFHHPFADSTGNPVSTVIGFAIPEIIDERTANNDNIQVRPVGGGDPVPGDFIWSSYQVLNFVPRQMLEPDTTYEVRFVEGGLKDVAGNGIDEFSFFFSTGNSLDANEAPQVDSLGYGSDSPVAVGESVTFTASASDAEGDPIEYRWSVDGGASTEWRTGDTFSTSFDTLGQHSVGVQVRDDQGGISSSSRSIVVVESTTASTATGSGPLALDATGRVVWAVNPDNNSVTAIDADTLEKRDEIEVCEDPTGVAVDASRRVWIACRDADAVQVRDSDGSLLDTLSTGRGSRPFAVVVAPGGGTVYVTETGSGELTKINAADRSIESSLMLGREPRAMAMSPDGGRLLVTRFISEDAGGTVWDVDPDSLTLNGTITLPLDETTSDSGTAARGVPNYLAGVAVNPANSRAMVVGKKDNIVRGLARDGSPLTFDTTVRNAIATLDLGAGEELFEERVDIDNHAQPSAVTYSPLGSHAFVTMQGNNRVVVVNPASGNEVARADVGLAPQGVLVDPDTNRVFVKNFMGRSVSVLDADAMLNTGSDELPELATVDTVAGERLGEEVLRGKRIFYNAADERMALEGYLSCATCHNDGDQDGRVWDFTDRGEGLRNTIALRGRAGTGHGRVHWTANFDEIHDFENDIRGPFSGDGFLSDSDFEATSDPLGEPKAGRSDDLDALAAYVSSLDTFAPSPYRNDDGSLTADAEAGRALFEEQGCAGCHGGEAFTDSVDGLMHDVGTLGADSGNRRDKELLGIDTPTLRDVWNTAPYLHDGSAPTLEAVLTTANPDDGHGVTSTLSETEVSQLAAYLRQIDGSEPAFTGQGIELALASLDDGDSVSEGQIPLAITTSLSDVDEVTYYADGEAVASSTEGPDFAEGWAPGSLGDYRLQARAVYNDGNTASLTPEIRVNFGGSNDCNVQYEIANDWNAGFQVNVTVTNNGDSAISGYELAWDMGSGETFDSGWNASFSTSDSTVTASVEAGAHNGTLAAGGGTGSFGFQASNSSPPASVPSSFNLNGTACSVGDQSSTNAAPVADFSATSTGLSVEVDASGSSDADGDSLSYSWEFGDGSTGSGATADHSYTEAGTYTVTLTVSDGTDNDTAAVDVSVSQPNTAPNASFTAATDGLNVSVDGSGSQDDDGDSLSYDWDFGDGNSGTGVTADHEYAEAGTYTVTLTVSDGTDSDTATTDVTVSGDGNTAPQAAFTADTSELNVSLDASDSSDADGDTLSYSWDFGDGDSGSGVTADHSYADEGTYTITLTVSDGTDNDTISSDVSVSQSAENNAPVAAAEAAPDSGEAPLDVSFDASGSSDPDGDALSYNWDFGDGNTATGATPDHTYSAAGSYTATVTVSDGELEDTAEVDIEVSESLQEGGLTCEIADSNIWGSGYVVSVTVTNDSDSSISGWTVALELNQSTEVTNSWSATVSADGSTVTAESFSYNGSLSPGQSTSFGLQGTHDGNLEITGCTAAAQ